MSRAQNLTMHRCLTSEETESLIFSPMPPKARGTGQELELTADGTATDNTYSLQPDDEWNAEDFPLSISQGFSLSTLNLLFDGNESPLAVALDGDTIGIMATWWSSQSDITGCERIGTFTAEDVADAGSHVFTFRKTFDPGTLKGTLEIHYHLYLSKKGEKKKPGFAHEVGTLLADIGLPLSIILDGTGASFPMTVTEAENRPLWWTEINIVDPFEEPFTEDYFSLVLNASHPDYDALRGRGKNKKGTFDSALFREVLAGAIEELFLYLNQNYHSQFEGVEPGDAPEGTIAAAALYLKQFIDPQNMMTLHESVRTMLSNRLGDTLKKEVAGDEMEDVE